uniref:apoptosis regulator Bcl-2-like n=1 Tax=Semicossyphus pulcher TaxID=241346 RepID=UPI0037E7F042
MDGGQQGAMATAYNSRDVVEDFLRLRLRQDGLDWRVVPCRTHPSAPTPPSARAITSQRGLALEDLQPDPSLAPPPLQVVLRCAGNRLARRYHGDLAAHVSVLLQSDGRGAPSLRGLTAVREELFRDGVNWGRIVAMMELGGALCTQVARRGGAQQVEEVASWMEEGLDSLRGWIEHNGGWDAFVELYGESTPAVSIWSLRTLVGLAVLGAAGIILAALFSQK